MANKSVLELAVGTGSWDAGLKKAKQALDNFTQAQGGLQKALNTDSDKMQQFVRMMGQMDSTAKTAKGQLNDYKGTIETLTMQYNRMTEAQKKTIGQDYLQAIDSMKQKYQAVNEELKEMNQSLNGIKIPDTPAAGGGSLFGGGKLDGMLQVLGGNLMTKAAGALAGLAADMGDMVTQGIEMAKAGEGIRIAFERLNQPGLLDNLREATHGTVTNLELMKAAVKFNDFKLPVEELGTMLAFAQQKAKDTGQSVDYMVDSIVTGLGRKSLMILDNLGLSATEIKEKMKETGDMTKAVGEIIREQMSKAGDYVETAADRATRADVDLKNAMDDLGRTFQPLSDTGTSMFNSLKVSALNLLNDAVKPLIQAFTQLGAVQKIQDNVNGGGFMGRITNNLRNANNKDFVYSQQMMAINRAINRAQGNLNEAEKGGKGSIEIYRNRLQALINIKNEYERVAQSIMKAETNIATGGGGSTTGGGGGKGGGGKGGSGKTTTAPTYAEDSIAAQSALVSDLRKKWSEAGEAVRNDLLVQLIAAEDKLKSMNNQAALFRENQQGKLLGNTPDGNAIQTTGLGSVTSATTISEKSLQDLANKIKDAMKDSNKSQSKGEKYAIDGISQMNGGISSIVSGIESLGVEIPEGLKQGLSAVQGITNILLGISATVLAIEAIAGADAFLPFARGGVVHAAGGVVAGNTYSGDQIPAMLNAGEVVLNRAQQGAIASQLSENGGGGGGYVPSSISGEQIFIAMNRYTRRTGKGEIVTWK